MANKLFFDLETIPAPEAQEETLRLLHEKKKGKQLKRNPDAEPISYEEFYDETGVDGTYGRICCIGYALNDEPVQVLSGPDNEREMVKKFWEIAGRADMFVGHNIRDFDLPFVMQRSVVLGVKPTWDKFDDPAQKKWNRQKFLDFARYRNHPIFDTMWEWSNWTDKWNNKGIEHIALALGIPTPKEGIDGSQVYEFYKKGKLKEICDYCMRDVETTREVYKRMTFENLPPTETLPF